MIKEYKHSIVYKKTAHGTSKEILDVKNIN